jgi:hypothetical protein
VPVFFAGRGPDGVAGAYLDDGAVGGGDQADAVGAVQGLAEAVEVPVGACAGGEADVATISRDGSSGVLTWLTYTSPVKFCAGALAVG